MHFQPPLRATKSSAFNSLQYQRITRDLQVDAVAHVIPRMRMIRELPLVSLCAS